MFLLRHYDASKTSLDVRESKSVNPNWMDTRFLMFICFFYDTTRVLFFMQRRNSLEEWMTKLLSDIDLSRSIFVASFLELEAAARSCACSSDLIFLH